MSLDQILNDIEKTEKELKKKYTNWRVKVANAKSITDMEIDYDAPAGEMAWSRYYLDNLRNQI